jgi:Zn-dependent peptidase ImmA (M78 family)/transcriptional regulator with XRE-family HTH domain
VPNQMARAREDATYSQDDVANMLGVSRVMISYWESGNRSPNDRQLAALAKLYRVSAAQLLGDEPVPTRADEAAMLFRGAGAELSAEARRGLSEFSDFLGNYAALAELVRSPIRGLRQSPFQMGKGYDTGEDAARKAQEVRSYLQLGMGPINDMDSVADLLGITVFRVGLGADLSTALSGAFFNHPGVGFAILVNLDMTPGRRRFTVAHEIGHALFHSNEKFILSRPHGNAKEHFADLFASEFLMPMEGIRRMLEENGAGPRVSDPADVIHLQRYFNVSYATALVRLLRANVISEQSFEEFQDIRPVLFAQSLGYEIADEEFVQDRDEWRIRRFPRRFLGLLRMAVQRGIISAPSAANLAGLAVDDIEELIADSQRGEPDPAGDREINEYRASGVLAAG